MSGTPPATQPDGRRDLRMLPVALAMWAGELAVTAAGGPEGVPVSSGVLPPAGHMGMMILVAVPAALACCTAIVYARRRLAGIIRSSRRIMLSAGAGIPLLILVLVASGAGVFASTAHQRTQLRDPVMRIARQAPQPRLSTLDLSIDTPLIASSRRGADCQADITIIGVHEAGQVTPSHASARLFASGSVCTSLDHGMRIRTQARLSLAAFGSRPVWVSDPTNTGIIRAPRPARALANRMRHEFAAITARLSDQGRILVPGLTCGLLGQDYIGPGVVEQPDATYATRVEQEFRTSGIMHLMAVSGGHFILVAQLALWVGAAVHLPRPAVAVGVMVAYQGLALLVYPSDSVLRAQIMGTLSAIGMVVGRPPQTTSTLAWTTLIVLSADPGKSSSYGYALSSAAVLGITLCASPLQRWLERALPHGVSQAIAATLSAQILTLPIQILMEPQIPLLSLLANLIVAPFVSWATITGLIALLLAPVAPTLAYAAAWLASCGTAIMAWTAHVCATPAWTSLAWPAGIPGALLALAVQAAFVLLPVVIRLSMGIIGEHANRLNHVQPVPESGRQPWHHPAPAGCGQSSHSHARQHEFGHSALSGRPWRAHGKIRTWLAETRAMIDDEWHDSRPSCTARR